MHLKCFVAFAALSASHVINGQSVATTDPVGFVSASVPAQSDSTFAVPFHRSAGFRGVIQSISGNTLTVVGSPNWSTLPKQWVFVNGAQNNTYAAMLATGVKIGQTAKIIDNGSNTVTVELELGDNLTGVKTEIADGTGQGDHLDILPYWTPSTLFTNGISQGAEMLLFNGAPAGINLSSTKILSFDTGLWYDNDTFDSADHFALPFGAAFILRNHSGAAMNLQMVGSVPMIDHRILVRTVAANKDQDIRVGYMSPIPEKIGTLGLGFTNDDQLLVFNNSTTGFNKSASQVLFYTTSDGWVDDTFSPVNDTFFLQPGFGYVFRKKSTGAAASFIWQSTQSYLSQ